MSIVEQIEKDLITSLKAKEALRASTLRMMKAALTNARIEKIGTLTDEESVKVLKTEIKKRKDSVEAYTAGAREDLADKEKKEIEIIEAYLPQQMSEDDIRAGIDEVLASLEDKSNFGKVMGAVMAKFHGQADGTLVRKILEEKLS